MKAADAVENLYQEGNYADGDN